MKGDFCDKVNEILSKQGRADDYIEIGLDSDWAYNPLCNDLEGYALADGIASLLDNLFGKGKEPFRQQAYANLEKFVISLHQVGFGYVIRHVYLDFDRNGGASLAAIRNSTEVPPPSFVLDTSPGKHQAVWKVTDFTQYEAESLLHRLANHFDGDLAATDATRVLRLPCFANRKLPEEFLVHARQESNAVYTRRDFTIDEDSPRAPRHFDEAHERRRTAPKDNKSQSELDWAYAKRALSRGDDSALVPRCIAAYRAEQKSDPLYHLQRTVRNARAALHGKIATVRTIDSQRSEEMQHHDHQRDVP